MPDIVRTCKQRCVKNFKQVKELEDFSSVSNFNHCGEVQISNSSPAFPLQTLQISNLYLDFWGHVHTEGSSCEFVYLGFYVAFNTVQVISQRVVGRAEETST